MEIISVRENPTYCKAAIEYIQDQWASQASMMVYEDCISHATDPQGTLPQWYLLMDDQKIIGCAGLITNDFISRMDLYPWVCAVFIDEGHRGKGLGHLLLEKAKEDTVKAGFDQLYLCTDHIGYYEKYGFTYMGEGYHPWGDQSRIYASQVLK